MAKSYIFLVSTLCIIQCMAQDIIPHPECSSVGSTGKTLKLFINSKKNQDDDEWVTTYSAYKNSSSSSNEITLDVTQNVIDCQGNKLVHIYGVLKERTSEVQNKALFFHKKCSSDAAIINNGRTFQKIKVDGHGAALTNRPLMDNELFEVRLEKKLSKFNYALGLGITTLVPGTFDVPNHMNSLKSGVWMLYHTHLYQNGAVVYTNYLKKDLKDLEIGTRIGIMRSNFDTLHYYINGVDQGPAASKIPNPVYGALELFGDASQVTIVEPTPKMTS